MKMTEKSIFTPWKIKVGVLLIAVLHLALTVLSS
jgi:hypothetical protein